jgi:hypothetical protein
MLRTELSNIQIEELVQSRKLSVRAMNVCRNGKLYTLEDLVTFYKNAGTFINLRNSGFKSALELRDFCDSVIGSLDSYKTPDEGGINNEVEVMEKLDDEDIKINKWKSFFECLSDNQKTLYGLIYHNEMQTLNVRSANSISKFNFTEFFFEVFCIRHFSFQSLQYIGKSSIVYLNLFKSRIENELIRISLLSETDCFLEIYMHKFGYLDADGFVKIFFESNGHLPLFWVLEKQLKSNTDRELEILRKSFNIFKKEKNYSLSEIASQLNNISKERVRQLRNKSFEEFFSCDSTYFKNTEDWLCYRNIVNSDVISPNSKEIIVDIIRNEQTEFTPIFIIQVLSILFSTEFVLLGGLEYVTNEQTNRKVTLLINSELYSIFDFEKFRDEIQELIDLQRYEEYRLNFEEYLLNCLSWRIYSLDKLDSIKDVTSEILLNEFRLYADIDGNIVIPANSEKHPTLIIYDILNESGSPMHINDIFVEFKKILPEHKYINPEQLRPYIARNESIAFINRSSTYALREWDHIKTGTIRDSIVEFLMLTNIPQPDDEIANYVLKFFPCSNISSIRTTMYNDTKKRFIYFKGGLFGLRNKRYLTKYEKVEKEDIPKRSFEERLYDFEKFIIENDHFPFSCSSNKTEEKLNRWWSLTINGKKSLTQNQIKEIERIKIQYKDYVTDKNTFLWNNNYNNFKCFLIENHRLPYASIDEKFLYGWWRRISSDYAENKLAEEQNMKYIKLCKLL